MSENPHHVAAQYGELPVEERQIEAALALAYEQRTANLIAMFTDGATGPVPDIDYGALIKQITERLRL